MREFESRSIPLELIFTGVGHRKGVPDPIRNMATNITSWLCARGVKLRTGDATGMDEIFRTAAPKDMCQFFAPHGRYNKHPDATMISPSSTLPCYYSQARDITANTHPAYHHIGDFERELHIRNAFEVLGTELNQPSNFLLCWTKDGAEAKTTRETGGTGQAIRLALHYNIPVFNFQAPNFESRFRTFIKHLGEQQNHATKQK